VIPYSSHRGYFKGTEYSGSPRYCRMLLACGIVSLRHGSHCKCIRTLTGPCRRGEGRPWYMSCQKMKPKSSSQMPSTKPSFPQFLLSARVEGNKPNRWTSSVPLHNTQHPLLLPRSGWFSPSSFTGNYHGI
jgi:hypothetical protein